MHFVSRVTFIYLKLKNQDLNLYQYCTVETTKGFLSLSLLPVSLSLSLSLPLTLSVCLSLCLYLPLSLWPLSVPLTASWALGGWMPVCESSFKQQKINGEKNKQRQTQVNCGFSQKHSLCQPHRLCHKSELLPPDNIQRDERGTDRAQEAQQWLVRRGRWREARQGCAPSSMLVYVSSINRWTIWTEYVFLTVIIIRNQSSGRTFNLWSCVELKRVF